MLSGWGGELTSWPSEARLKVEPRGVLSGSPYSQPDRAVDRESPKADEPRGIDSVSLIHTEREELLDR